MWTLCGECAFASECCLRELSPPANSFHKLCVHHDRPITQESIERFRRKAEECRWKASIEFDPALKREIELTAVAYERMAQRAERFLSGA